MVDALHYALAYVDKNGVGPPSWLVDEKFGINALEKGEEKMNPNSGGGAPPTRRYNGPIAQGDAFVYVERNAVFRVHSLPTPASAFYTVYYEATGQYRRYSEDRIRGACVPYTAPPKRRPKPPAQPVSLPTTATGLPNALEVHEDGTIVCGCHRSRPGTYGALVGAVMKGRPKGFGGAPTRVTRSR
jgi:hypothetical protein